MVEAVEADVLLPDEAEMRWRPVMTSSSSHSSSPSSSSRRFEAAAAIAAEPTAPLDAPDAAAAAVSLCTDPCAAVVAAPPKLGLGRMCGLLEAISGFEEDERRLPSDAALKVVDGERMIAT